MDIRDASTVEEAREIAIAALNRYADLSPIEEDSEEDLVFHC
jgi:hypothetical protein